MIEPRPTLIVVAGPNGSGKTSLTTKVLQHKWVDGSNKSNRDEENSQSRTS
jgi:predicted ABC-type ATPase